MVLFVNFHDYNYSMNHQILLTLDQCQHDSVCAPRLGAAPPVHDEAGPEISSLGPGAHSGQALCRLQVHRGLWGDKVN